MTPGQVIDPLREDLDFEEKVFTRQLYSMEYSKFSQREVCKDRTDAHKLFAKRFKEDTDLKCADLLLPDKVAAASNYSKDVELELYQRR